MTTNKKQSTKKPTTNTAKKFIPIDVSRLPKQIPQVQHLIDALECDNPKGSQLLVKTAMEAIFAKNTVYSEKKSWTPEDLDAVVSLIRGIKPKDTIEVILACQFVAFHLQGMAASAANFPNAKSHGIQMTRLCHRALELLDSYRSKRPAIDATCNELSHE